MYMSAKCAIAAGSALVLGCAAVPTAVPHLDKRVAAVLESRGFGVEALQIVDNLLRHGPPAPRATPPLVLDLLARPLAAVDAERIFRESVPASLGQLQTSPPSVSFEELLKTYIDELAEAQQLLRKAVKPFQIDLEPPGLPTPRQLTEIAAAAGEQARQGINYLTLFTALISVNLAVLNLLPVPMLDGGHLLFFVCAAVLGRPISLRKRETAQQ